MVQSGEVDMGAGPFKYAVIAASSSGDNELVAAVTGKKIRVLAYCIVGNDAAVTARFESGAGGTALSGQMKLGTALATNFGFAAGFNPAGWFETAEGQNLNLELSAAQSVAGHLTYVEVD